MKRLAILVFVVCSVFNIDAQTNDSIVLKDLINKAHQHFIKGRLDQSQQLNDSISRIKALSRYPSLAIKHYSNCARSLSMGGDHKKAIERIKIALSQIDSTTISRKGSLNAYISQYYSKLGSMDSMLHYFDLAEDLNTQYNPYRNWSLYEQTGVRYVTLKMYNEAEQLFIKAYNITAPKSNRMDHGLTLYRLIRFYETRKDLNAYIKYQKEYDDLTKGNSFTKNNFHHFVSEGSEAASKEDLAILLAACQENKFYNCINFANENLAELAMKQEAFEEAIQYLEANKKLPDFARSQPSQLDLNLQLAKAYHQSGQYQKSAKAYQNALSLQESIFDTESKEIVVEYEEKYKATQKEQAIKTLASQNEIKDQTIRRKNTTQLFMLGLILAAMAIILLTWYLLRQRSKYLTKVEEQNAVITKNLADKEILLREIHHRVKNNLQVISSLLSLQSNYIEDEKALIAINEGKNRVSSMALIHQNLYQKDFLTSIFLPDYMTELIENLFDSYNINFTDITLTTNIAPIRLDIDTMIPLGLIVNELVSNALKHAYTKGIEGKLVVTIKEIPSGLSLTVQDNGIGLNPDKFNNSNSFGNKMIQAFKKKLGASLSIYNEGGTTFEMIIKKYEVAA